MGSRLEDQRVLIFGASSGIGREIAKTYIEEGAKVAIASRSIEELNEVAENANNEIIPFECDVRNGDSIKEAVDNSVKALSGIDVAVNSAGVISRTKMVDETDEEIGRVVDINLKGMMKVAREVIPELKKTEGVFIPVSSQLGEVGVENASVYCGTKGGINNLTRQLAIEYADYGVRVNALAPGIVKTAMNAEERESSNSWEEKKTARIPMDRLATPREIAEPAVFLASSESSYMTGHVLIVDGGYIAQ